jgi:hypothetical protein
MKKLLKIEGCIKLFVKLQAIIKDKFADAKLMIVLFNAWKIAVTNNMKIHLTFLIFSNTELLF